MDWCPQQNADIGLILDTSAIPYVNKPINSDNYCTNLINKIAKLVYDCKALLNEYTSFCESDILVSANGWFEIILLNAFYLIYF